MKVFVNGLYPGNGIDGEENPGSRVVVFDLSKEKNEDGWRILYGYADSAGVVHSKIPNSYVEREVMIRIRLVGFKPVESIQRVPSYGVFYTPRLEKDHVVSKSVLEQRIGLDAWNSWDTGIQFSEAQARMIEEVRTIKSWNNSITVINGSLSIGAAIGLAFVNPVLAIAGGVTTWVMTEVISKKLSGQDTRLPIPYTIQRWIINRFWNSD